jgi:hypothetical protein
MKFVLPQSLLRDAHSGLVTPITFSPLGAKNNLVPILFPKCQFSSGLGISCQQPQT